MAGTALSGWAFGSCFPLLVLAVAEIFGKERLASNYMIFDGSPGAVGTVVVAKFLANGVYDSHEVDGKCDGDECFRVSHMVIIGVQLAVAVLGCVLSMRVQVVYDAICEGNAKQRQETS